MTTNPAHQRGPAPTPPPWGPGTCVSCGQGPLLWNSRPITRKRRYKFGLLWLLATLLTCGIAILFWIVMPRYKETIGYDRWLQCQHCGFRQP